MTEPTSHGETAWPNVPRIDAVRVLSHTHWDREWYHPAGRFRQRLVALVDELLDAPDGAPFLLDGQAIALEDYLAVRPERRALLERRLAEGAIEAGPWYVLADELIPGGEALVRNLLEGRRQLASLGAERPAVLYCPDSFGHPAALPFVARGFGCEVVVLWRGYGGARWPAGDAARWQGPDHSEVLLFHLPPDGYEFGSSLPVDDEAAAARWRRMRDVLAPRARLGLLLVHNGADHHARQRELPAALAALGRAAAPLHPARTSLGALGLELAGRAERLALPDVRGELRDSYGYTWTLQGTFASRAYQKRRNAIAERTLVRDAEPLQALALWDATADERERAAAVVRAAWRALLRCHPHDTLCGCSTDEVARAMDARLDDATTQSRGVRDDAIATLAGVDAVAARERPDAWQPTVVVRNAMPYGRSGAAEVEILTPLAAVRVGPGSAGTPNDLLAPGTLKFNRRREVGGVPVQILSRRVVHHRVESPLHYPSDALVLRERAVAFVRRVGGLGLLSFDARRTSGHLSLGGGTPPVVRRGRTFGNARLMVTVDRDGRVTLKSLRPMGLNGEYERDDVRIDDLLSFESMADLGDLYTPSPRGTPLRAEFRGARVRHRGPIRYAVALRYRLSVPASSGSERAARIDLVATLSIDADCDLLAIDVRGRNRARDHRLRVRIATGLAGARTLADAAFGAVERRALEVPAEDAVAETPPPTAPMHRYVARVGEAYGVTVIGDGLAEYEAAADGALLVTLVRAVGELSRADLPERPGHAGWPVRTPEAQCQGAFRARFGVRVQGPRATVCEIDRAAAEFLSPLAGVTLREHDGSPVTVPEVLLRGRGLALSALKLGADARWTVARVVNLDDAPTRGSLSLGRALREARQARLDETPLEALLIRDGAVEFEAGPREVVTILLR